MESEWVGVISYCQRGRESKWASAILYNLPPQVRSNSNFNNSGSIRAREDLRSFGMPNVYCIYLMNSTVQWKADPMGIQWTAALMNCRFDEKPPHQFFCDAKTIGEPLCRRFGGWPGGGGGTQTCDVTMIFSVLLWANWVDGPLPSMLGPLLSFTSQDNHITPIVNLKLQ